jgi:hypothetical protein
VLSLPPQKLRRVRAGEIVSTLEGRGRGITELIAYGAFEADPGAVWVVLDDVENYVHTMPKVKISEIIERREGGLRMRMVLDSPFPLPDISSTYESVHTVADGVWRRQWQQVDKGLAPNSGSWTLVPMPDAERGTLAEYRVRVEPLIPIPKAIVKFAHNRVVPEVFRMVNEHSSRVR